MKAKLTNARSALAKMGVLKPGMAGAVAAAAATPARAQDINLDPIQNVLQGIVDLLTGPLGLVAATLALIGVFISWMMSYVDFRTAVWVMVGVAGIGGAATIAVRAT